MPCRSSGSRYRTRVLQRPKTCSMAEAMTANSASLPVKRARTRPMTSALSSAVAGSATPGFDRYSSGKLKGSYRGPEGERDQSRYHTRVARFEIKERSIRATCHEFDPIYNNNEKLD